MTTNGECVDLARGVQLVVKLNQQKCTQNDQ